MQFRIQDSEFRIQNSRLPSGEDVWFGEDDVFCIVRSLWFPVRNAAGLTLTSVGAGL